MAENAVNNNERGIKESYSLVAFARMKGTPYPNSSKNRETGLPFNNLCFIDKDNNKTFVAFSSNLGELSSDEVKARKDELQVVKLNDDPVTHKEGGWILCQAGNLNLGEAIDLFS